MQLRCPRRLQGAAMLVAMGVAVTGCSVFRGSEPRPSWADIVVCELGDPQECIRRAAVVVRYLLGMRGNEGMRLTSIIVRPIDVEACARRGTLSMCTTWTTDEVMAELAE